MGTFKWIAALCVAIFFQSVPGYPGLIDPEGGQIPLETLRVQMNDSGYGAVNEEQISDEARGEGGENQAAQFKNAVEKNNLAQVRAILQNGGIPLLQEELFESCNVKITAREHALRKKKIKLFQLLDSYQVAGREFDESDSYYNEIIAPCGYCCMSAATATRMSIGCSCCCTALGGYGYGLYACFRYCLVRAVPGIMHNAGPGTLTWKVCCAYAGGGYAATALLTGVLLWCQRSACESASKNNAAIRISSSLYSARIFAGELGELPEDFSNEPEYFRYKSLLTPGYENDENTGFSWGCWRRVADENLELQRSTNYQPHCQNSRLANATTTFHVTPLHAALLVSDTGAVERIVNSLQEQGKLEQLTTPARIPLHMIEQLNTSYFVQLVKAFLPGLDCCDDSFDYPLELTSLQLAEQVGCDEAVDLLSEYLQDIDVNTGEERIVRPSAQLRGYGTTYHRLGKSRRRRLNGRSEKRQK